MKSDQRGDSQTAYQVIVSESLEEITQGQGDVWDSGIIQSEATNNIEYQGQELSAKKRYYWSVHSYNIFAILR